MTASHDAHEQQKEPENVALAAARDYTRRGWRVVPVIPGQKGVALTGWQAMRLDEDELPKWFGPIGGRGGGGLHHNIGVLLGEPSGGLVDVDCDAPEAREAAEQLLPPTGMISGRASNPASHYWYRVVGELPATTKYADPSPTPPPRGEGLPDMSEPFARMGGSGSPPRVGEGGAQRREGSAHHTTMLIELRSTGGQTVVPPSVHPSGEVVRWERGSISSTQGEPSVAPARELRAAVARVAAVALVARHWPDEGQRDEAAKDLAGLLVRGGWAEEEVDHFTRLVARIAGDEEWQQRAKARGTARKLAEGSPVTGGKSLAARLSGHGADGVRIVSRLVVWLGLGRSEDSSGRSGGLGSAYVQEAHQEAHIHSMSFLAHDEPLGRIEQIGQLLAEVTPTPVRPIWGGRLYQGKLTICDGDPGHGKTLLALDLAARITAGHEMPDGSPGIGPAGVVYFTAEDDPADTLRPRLDAAGGDPDRLLVVTTVRLTPLDGAPIEHQPSFRDLTLIERAIERVEAKLVIFDPFMAYLDSQTNSFRDQDVRGVLAPLARLAERTGAAFFLIRHLNKGGGGHALYRGGGSIGIIGAARSGLLVGCDPDNPERRVVASTKNNLGMSPTSLAYRVVGSPSGAPIIAWEGESPYDARALLQEEVSAPTEPALTRAAELLRAFLADGPQPEPAVQAYAQEHGVSLATLRRARARCDILSKKASYAGSWLWYLPPQEAHPAQEAHAGNMSNLASNELLGEHGAPLSVHTRPSPSSPSASSSSVCRFTGGAHVYATFRNAQGRLLCVECFQPKPEGEDEPSEPGGDAGQDGQGAQP